MRIRVLLFSILAILVVSKAQAQLTYITDTIRTLIMTEIRQDEPYHSYVELTNVGTTVVNLGLFEFGCVNPWNDVWLGQSSDNALTLPSVMLGAGESFLIANYWDLNHEYAKKYPDQYQEITQLEWWTKPANIQIHVREQSDVLDPNDSISTNGVGCLDVSGGQSVFYLKQYFSRDSDSYAIVDAFNNDLTESSGLRRNDEPSDVAGYTDATYNCILVRKASVKKGTTDWETSKGTSTSDSEWLPIPFLEGHLEPYRKLFKTVGNHGNYTLSSTTFTSSKLTINFDAGTIEVPWGVRRDDSIISVCSLTGGMAWHYDYSSSIEDSFYVSVRTGDKLTMYACGNTLQTKVFKLILKDPTDDINVVLPLKVRSDSSFYPLYAITDGVSGMDSILDVPFATRKDTLLKYIEVPANATCEFVWVDGKTRVDLKSGDILKVTSKSGKTKNYYIKVDKYSPAHDASLSAITWPDIPDSLIGLYGWESDTIPGFAPDVYSYVVPLPSGQENVPAIVAKTTDTNAEISITRAKTLRGGNSNRTTKFTVSAEDDTTKLTYSVQFEKQKSDDNIQINSIEPFISEVVFQSNLDANFIEICNPGNVSLDLSKYMVAVIWEGSSATEALTDELDATSDSWDVRYRRYVPGRVWSTQKKWLKKPGLLEEDSNVDAVVPAGGVFAMGRQTWDSNPYMENANVTFSLTPNSFGESFGTDWMNCLLNYWCTYNIYLFRIDNDSILNGTKPVGNIDDFTLIDAFGGITEDNAWSIGGEPAGQETQIVRKPSIYKGDTVLGASFGTNSEDSEWLVYDADYYSNLGYSSPESSYMLASNIGTHELDDITDYLSTISSIVYIVSDGYSVNETLRGVKTGATVAAVIGNVIKADEGQTITIVSKSSGGTLANTATVTDGDILVVVSANKKNTTKYTISVASDGLSSNAKLTSSTYTVTNSSSTKGTISGFGYSVTLETVVNAVTVPSGATMSVIDGSNLPVPLKKLNFDTTYVAVAVSDDIYFEVIAEDGETTMKYQLKPTLAQSDVFVISDVYTVDQTASLISLVPRGSTVATLMNNITTSSGATVWVDDKAGFERESGTICQDDKLVAESEDGLKTRAYRFSMLSSTANSYLAFVYSTVLSVDQYTSTIKSSSKALTETTLVSTLLSYLVASFGATVEIKDNAGSVKASGSDLNSGDYVLVTSANGLYTTTYSLVLSSGSGSAGEISDGALSVYPNPTNGLLTISGTKAGQQIDVYTLLGSKMTVFDVVSSNQTISLETCPKGLYFVFVRENNKVVGTFKIYKQ